MTTSSCRRSRCRSRPQPLVIDGDRIVDGVAGRRRRARRRGRPARSLHRARVHRRPRARRRGHRHARRRRRRRADRRRLPRFGVTAFCPDVDRVRTARSRSRGRRGPRRGRPPGRPPARAAAGAPREQLHQPRVHGAQPRDCLRLPRRDVPRVGGDRSPARTSSRDRAARPTSASSRSRRRSTAAPRSDPRSAPHGHHVSLGHSGATYEQAMAAIAAGARQATHLFNRMPPLGHRAPGLAAAVLERRRRAEIICDGVHVHPAMVRVALAAKAPSRVMAITDGTPGRGCRGSRRPGGSADQRRRRRVSRRWHDRRQRR